MSLVSLAARVCLTKALLGRTLAEDRVFDSQISPIDFKGESALPVVIIYTDNDVAHIGHTGWNRPEKREMQIVVELTIAAPVTVEGDAGTVEIPQTDAGLEASIDFLEREVFRAAMEPAGNVWADLFRRLISASPTKMERNRGAGTEKGIRFAARQIIITVDPTSEPDFGAEPELFWADLIAAMKADTDLVDLGAVLHATIVGTPLPSWQVVQAQLGLSGQGIRAMGLAPLQGGADPVTGEAPVQLEATLEDQDRAVDITITDGTTEPYELP